MKNKLVRDRGEVIEQYVVGKKVLDVGCAELMGTTTEDGKLERWIHKKIKKLAREVVGVDINEKQVEALRARVYLLIRAET